jgi:hypothetical protein
MDQISTRIGQEASHVSVPDEMEPSANKMMMLNAEFREKQSQLQTLIEQRKAKYVSAFFFASCFLENLSNSFLALCGICDLFCVFFMNY